MPNARVDFKPSLQAAVEEFREAIGYKKPLKVSGPYYPYDDIQGEETYPCSGMPGCYIFADGTGRVKYIG